MKMPAGEKIDSLDNSKASAYKGKLTILEQPPYILQNIMYTDLAFILFYLIGSVYVFLGRSPPLFIKKTTLIFFEVFFIDQNILIYRTLGYLSLDSEKDFYDYLSLLVSMMIQFIQVHYLLSIYIKSKGLIIPDHKPVEKKQPQSP
jgi:hypothetical protein